ncbi:hypothetical protein [Macrococcus armenti]|uniref:hypothetical protein n=1 Tax=Macrococcus armenti TaxID=2875764 RepID=UPI001CC97B55|nr:hypothetical protein [Macrococcus armenti]UBH16589.1 hypothetical protein LAU44_12125 [Macrococcus armenti]UBH21224.1 hypothetical protein LAU40_12160 [Macrococcus armenti]
MIDYVSNNIKIMNHLDFYVDKGVLNKEVDNNLVRYYLDNTSNSLYISEEDYFHKSNIYFVKDDEYIYLRSDSLTLDLHQVLEPTYTNKILEKFELEGLNIQIIKIKEISINELKEYYSELGAKLQKLLKNNKVNAEIVNHIIEFELGLSNFIKYAICENGKFININIHDAEIWKEKLNYKNFDKHLIVDYYLMHNKYNQEFIKNDYERHYILLDKYKYIYKDMIINLVTHGLEHIEEMENT